MFVFRPQGEGNEYMPSQACSSHRNQSVFIHGVPWVGRDAGVARKQVLNLGNRDAMLLALPPVAFIPIEPANP
jgi:hypothetical protein